MLRDFRACVGAEHVLTRPEDTLPYGFDGTAALRHAVGVVVFPGNTG